LAGLREAQKADFIDKVLDFRYVKTRECLCEEEFEKFEGFGAVSVVEFLL
jgi:hypothetical protein